MTERDLRRYEIMDQYGVDEDTAELMLIDEEEEEESKELKEKKVIPRWKQRRLKLSNQ